VNGTRVAPATGGDQETARPARGDGFGTAPRPALGGLRAPRDPRVRYPSFSWVIP
jgi:hypothetical protein